MTPTRWSGFQLRIRCRTLECGPLAATIATSVSRQTRTSPPWKTIAEYSEIVTMSTVRMAMLARPAQPICLSHRSSHPWWARPSPMAKLRSLMRKAATTPMITSKMRVSVP